MRYVIPLFTLLLTTILPATAQKEYEAGPGKLTDISTWTVDGQPATSLPTAQDECLLPEAGKNDVGGTFECGIVDLLGDLGIGADDTLIVNNGLYWFTSEDPGKGRASEGTLVFRGNLESLLYTNQTVFFGSVIIEKGLGPVRLIRNQDDPRDPHFSTQSLYLESGLLNLRDYRIDVQEIHQDNWMTNVDEVGITMNNPFGVKAAYWGTTDTVEAVLGKVAFEENGGPETRVFFGEFNQAVEEFKQSEHYSEEKTLIPRSWYILPEGIPLTWFFDTAPGDSVEIYDWDNGTFTPVPQQREPDGSVSVDLVRRGGVGYILVLAKVNVSTAAEKEEVPKKFSLFPAYPNPFNPSTTIPFEVGSVEHFTLTAYDILGRKVQVLVDEWLPPGKHEVIFEAKDLPSGIYVIRSNLGQTRTATLLK